MSTSSSNDDNMLLFVQSPPCTLPLTRRRRISSTGQIMCALEPQHQEVWRAFVTQQNPDRLHRVENVVRQTIEFIVRNQIAPASDDQDDKEIQIVCFNENGMHGYCDLQNLFDSRFNSIEIDMSSYDGMFDSNDNHFKARNITIYGQQGRVNDVPNIQCRSLIVDASIFKHVVNKLLLTDGIQLVPDDERELSPMLYVQIDRDTMFAILNSSSWLRRMGALLRHMLERADKSLFLNITDENSSRFGPDGNANFELWISNLLPHIYPGTESEMPSRCRVVFVEATGRSGDTKNIYVLCDRQHEEYFLRFKLGKVTTTISVVNHFGDTMNEIEVNKQSFGGGRRHLLHHSASTGTFLGRYPSVTQSILAPAVPSRPQTPAPEYRRASPLRRTRRLVLPSSSPATGAPISTARPLRTPPPRRMLQSADYIATDERRTEIVISPIQTPQQSARLPPRTPQSIPLQRQRTPQSEGMREPGDTPRTIQDTPDSYRSSTTPQSENTHQRLLEEYNERADLRRLRTPSSSGSNYRTPPGQLYTGGTTPASSAISLLAAARNDNRLQELIRENDPHAVDEMDEGEDEEDEIEDDESVIASSRTLGSQRRSRRPYQ